MSNGSKKYDFNADVAKVLKLVINSIYTNKDVFLRELISNASDACEKTRYLITSGQMEDKDGFEPHIVVSINDKENYLSVKDNGIGMNKDELISHLGTIAKSGTAEFLQVATKNKNISDDLIGQFGVGFYSCFMVADRVEVITKRRNSKDEKQKEQGYLWKSDGVNEFTIEETDDADFGTEIRVFIKDDEKDNYLNRFKVENIIKTYSNHISAPIEFIGEKNTSVQINPEKALWLQDKSSITEEQYENFYHSICHLPNRPLLTIHNKVEGNMEYTNLLFIPSTKPFDLYHPDMMTRIKLYVRHVFISEKDVDIIPPYLRFVYGIVDSNDLPLNVSRETLQDNRIISKIKDNLVKKIISELKDIAKTDENKYNEFWKNFGPVLKEGLCQSIVDRESLLELTRFYTNKSPDKLISFKDYIANMKKDQKDIYYFIGEKVDDMKNAPEMEIFQKNDVEVIFFTDVVDGFWTNVVYDYQGHDLKSILRADIDLNNISKEDKKEDQTQTDEEKDMTEKFMNVLQGKVVAVKIATKLVDSPSCLSIAPGAMDSRMEDFLVSQNQLKKRSLKILEINKDHQLVKKAYELLKNTDEKEKQEGSNIVQMIMDLACISQGGEHLENPAQSVKRILSLMK